MLVKSEVLFPSLFVPTPASVQLPISLDSNGREPPGPRGGLGGSARLLGAERSMRSRIEAAVRAAGTRQEMHLRSIIRDLS